MLVFVYYHHSILQPPTPPPYCHCHHLIATATTMVATTTTTTTSTTIKPPLSPSLEPLLYYHRSLSPQPLLPQPLPYNYYYHLHHHHTTTITTIARTITLLLLAAATATLPPPPPRLPPLVSRRILETLTYLARNHPYVAKILLQFKLPQPLLQESENLDKARGKALMIVEEDVMEGKNHLEGYFSIVMLLSLLSQPLYLRSIAHLEQLLSLLDVIVDNAESKSSLSNESGIPAAEQTSGPHISTSVADINTVSSAISSGSDITASKPNDDSKPSASSANAECDTQNVLDNLPQAELRLLCSLLAREGINAVTYTYLLGVSPTKHIGNLFHNLTQSVEYSKQALQKFRRVHSILVSVSLMREVGRFVVVGARIWFVRGEFGSWLKMEIVSHACLASEV
ncbi:hypothetical protein CsSME_00014126 [Camellia sinensis var. sinensis]